MLGYDECYSNYYNTKGDLITVSQVGNGIAFNSSRTYTEPIEGDDLYYGPIFEPEGYDYIPYYNWTSSNSYKGAKIFVSQKI